MAGMSSPRSRSTPRRHRSCCEVVEETLRNVEPLPRQNTFASFGPARNLKHNNVPMTVLVSNSRSIRLLETHLLRDSNSRDHFSQYLASCKRSIRKGDK
jgi:hypothetical protein